MVRRCAKQIAGREDLQAEGAARAKKPRHECVPGISRRLM